MSDAFPVDSDPVAVCVLRLERHHTELLITLSVTDDVRRRDSPRRLVTMDLENALDVVRETAEMLLASRIHDQP